MIEIILGLDELVAIIALASFGIGMGIGIGVGAKQDHSWDI